MPQFSDQIRHILQQHGKLPATVDQLTDESNLYAAGLTSHATVVVMLELEEAFGVQFPDHLLQRRTFESIAAIRAAVAQLTGDPSSATA